MEAGGRTAKACGEETGRGRLRAAALPFAISPSSISDAYSLVLATHPCSVLAAPSAHHCHEPVVALPETRPPASQSPHRSDESRFSQLSKRRRPLISGQNGEPLTRFVAAWAANPRGQPRGSQEWWLQLAWSDVRHPSSQRIAIAHRRDWLLTESPLRRGVVYRVGRRSGGAEQAGAPPARTLRTSRYTAPRLTTKRNTLTDHRD